MSPLPLMGMEILTPQVSRILGDDITVTKVQVGHLTLTLSQRERGFASTAQRVGGTLPPAPSLSFKLKLRFNSQSEGAKVNAPPKGVQKSTMYLCRQCAYRSIHPMYRRVCNPSDAASSLRLCLYRKKLLIIDPSITKHISPVLFIIYKYWYGYCLYINGCLPELKQF